MSHYVVIRKYKVDLYVQILVPLLTSHVTTGKITSFLCVLASLFVK